MLIYPELHSFGPGFAVVVSVTVRTQLIFVDFHWVILFHELQVKEEVDKAFKNYLITKKWYDINFFSVESK